MVSRSLRVALLALTLLLLMIVPARPGMGRSASPVAVAIISPPDGVSVPIGQGLEVRYASVGATATDTFTVELWCNDELLAVDRVESDSSREVVEEMAHFWAPEIIGPNQLSVRIFDEQGAFLASARLGIVGLSRGSTLLLPEKP